MFLGCVLGAPWMRLGCSLDALNGARLCPEQTVTVTWIVKSPSVMSQNLVLKKKGVGGL